MTENPSAHIHPPDIPHRHTTAGSSADRQPPLLRAAAPSSFTPAVEQPMVDVRDMIVVHTAMLREFRLAPSAVALVATGDRRAARRVDAHLTLLGNLLHHHHSGEDDLLWPPLRALLPAAGQALLEDAEAQHSDIDGALDQMNTARRRWAADVEDTGRAQLIAALQRLHELLAEHLDSEERTLLPLAAAHLTKAQWDAVGAAGAASLPRLKMLLVFGMFAYEGDPDVVTAMLRSAPAPARVIVPLIAPGSYARHAKRLYGTSRP